MIRPMPFWPSFEPWKKLTRVQVRIRMPRIHHGGGWSPFGSANSAGAACCMTILRTNSRIAASAKPNSGDSSSALPTLAACDQSTPEVPSRPRSRALAMPTPMMEPIRVCELEAGRPKYQVPTFQMMAAISRANTMAKPAPLPTCRISSTGSSDTMPKATAPVDSRTPNRLNMPDQTTAMLAGKRAGVDHRRHGVGRVVEAVDEFEAERNQQRDKEQEIGQIGRDLGAGRVDVDIDAVGDEQQRGRHDPRVDDARQRMKAAIEVWSLSAGGFDRTG